MDGSVHQTSHTTHYCRFGGRLSLKLYPGTAEVDVFDHQSVSKSTQNKKFSVLITSILNWISISSRLGGRKRPPLSRVLREIFRCKKAHFQSYDKKMSSFQENKLLCFLNTEPSATIKDIERIVLFLSGPGVFV